MPHSGTRSDAVRLAPGCLARWTRWHMTPRGIARRTLLGWVIGAVTLCVAHEAGAQARWGLGRWQGDGTFFLDWEKQDDKRSQTKYETILFQERLGLRNMGAFI